MREYNPYELTALKRTKLSVPMQKLYDLNLLKYPMLDFGCGNGDDARLLSNMGAYVDGYDKYNLKYSQSGLLLNNYDCVTCHYVFNVIRDLEEHRDILELLKTLSDTVYISVRSDERAIKYGWVCDPLNNCYRTSRGSYQRFYDEEMITRYFGDVEYIVNNSSYKLFKII